MTFRNFELVEDVWRESSLEASFKLTTYYGTSTTTEMYLAYGVARKPVRGDQGSWDGTLEH